MGIRVAIAGVGNVASAFVQGVDMYSKSQALGGLGLMHVEFGAYSISDIEFVAAFDVDSTKVGFDLADAIQKSPNNTLIFDEVAPLGVKVLRGPTLDGFGVHYRQVATVSEVAEVNVAAELRAAAADVLVILLPVGANVAARAYAEAALEAGVAVVNGIPVFLASDPEFAAKFTDAGVPIVGDDVKSQVGATITHRLLARMFEQRGVSVDRTYQLNVGGNMDFMNMLDRDRLQDKKLSKTRAVTSSIDQPFAPDDVHIGPSDYVPWLKDKKVAFIRLEGRGFGGAPLAIECRLEVWDSPNSAGVLIDAVRAAKIALDREIGGPIPSACAYFMKSPPLQMTDEDARDMLEKFITNEA